MNYQTYIGNVINNYTKEHLNNGNIVIRFKFKSLDNVNCVESAYAWGNLANFIETFCKRNSKLIMSGRWVNRTECDKQGAIRNKREFELRNLILL